MTTTKKSKALAFGAAAVAAIAPLALSAASAEAKGAPYLHISHILSSGRFVGPLQIAVDGSNVYVADSFTSHLWQVGHTAPLATGPDPSKGGDIAGVAVNTDNGDVAYTTTDFQHHKAMLVVLHDGKPVMQAHIRRYEVNRNPDKTQSYGAPAPTECFRNTLLKHHIPVSYSGAIDAHPYAVAYLGDGAWAVADAGGNDVLHVSKYGSVTNIKTIGKQDFVVTQQFAETNHLAACAVGHHYYTESVPTDVERGPDGQLYVSTLPGGPDGSGSRGAVYKVNPSAKTAQRIGMGFLNPTNLAVTRAGTVYVVEPFTGRVAVLSSGHGSMKAHLAGVAAIEAANGHLYAATAPSLVGSKQPSRVVELSY